MATLVAKGGRERYKCSKCGKDIPKGMRHYREGSSPNFTRYHVDCVKTKRRKGRAGKPVPFKVMMSTGHPTFVKASDKSEAREIVKMAVANDTLEGSVVSVSEVTPADVAQYPGILSKREKVSWNPGADKYTEITTDYHSKCHYCDEWAKYYGKRKSGHGYYWVTMCEKHFNEHGVGLGRGKGQRIIYAPHKFDNPGAQYHALEFDKAHALHKQSGEAYDSGMADAHRESFRRSIGLHISNPNRKASRRSVKSFVPLAVIGGLTWLIYQNRR